MAGPAEAAAAAAAGVDAQRSACGGAAGGVGPVGYIPQGHAMRGVPRGGAGVGRGRGRVGRRGGARTGSLPHPDGSAVGGHDASAASAMLPPGACRQRACVCACVCACACGCACVCECV
jgi:hypothetical protein